MNHSPDNILLPETAPVWAVLIAWPFPAGDWCHNIVQAQACYRQIVTCFLKHLQGVDIVVLLHPSIPLREWHEQVGQAIVKHARLRLIHTLEYDDTWIRDYGPLSLRGEYLAFSFNGWGEKYPSDKDNRVAQQVLACLGASCRKMDFVAEGGGLEINAQGYLLANRDCLIDERRNGGKTGRDVEQVLAESLGVNTFLWLEGVGLSGDDTDGHIDTLARFSEGEGIVYCGENASHPDAQVLSSLRHQIESLCRQQRWPCFALPTPMVYSEVDARLLPASYANFLIVNGFIFLPIYGHAYDGQAQRVLQRAFPSYHIVPVNCAALLEQHGSLHCATMQLAKIDQ